MIRRYIIWSNNHAYDEHDAKPYRWTYDGTPLKAA